MPLVNPPPRIAFVGYLGGDVTSSTVGNGTAINNVANVIATNRENVDLSNNFDTVTGGFTAPLTGKYLLSCYGSLEGNAASNAMIGLLRLRGGTYTDIGSVSIVKGALQDARGVSIAADLQAGDVIFVGVSAQSGSSGAIKGNNTPNVMFFSGSYIAPN